MAVEKIITLEHLRVAIRRVKEYIKNNYSPIDHTHEEYSDTDHFHESNSIIKMTGYQKAGIYTAISDNDSLNIAIGKLEKALDEIDFEIPDLSGIYLKRNEAAVSANKLTNYVQIALSGMVSGSVDFNGSEDVYIETSINNVSSNLVTSMKGYSMPESYSSIYPTDSLNVAIGKLERSIEERFSENDFAIKDHSHDIVTYFESGFMSSQDKIKLDEIEENANHYIHPTTSGNKHIPVGGQDGDVLYWTSEGTAGWVSSSVLQAEDRCVRNSLDQNRKAYITGATSNVTHIGEQIFDDSVYLTENPGELCAVNFIGDLTGTSTASIISDQTRGSLTIKLDGVEQDPFNGKDSFDVDITPSSINAVAKDEVGNIIAGSQATEQEVRDVLDSYFPAILD